MQHSNANCGDAITQNFYHSGCVFNVAYSQYNIPSLCIEVTKQVIVQARARGTIDSKSFHQVGRCQSLALSISLDTILEAQSGRFQYSLAIDQELKREEVLAVA